MAPEENREAFDARVLEANLALASDALCTGLNLAGVQFAMILPAPDAQRLVQERSALAPLCAAGGATPTIVGFLGLIIEVLGATRRSRASLAPLCRNLDQRNMR